MLRARTNLIRTGLDTRTAMLAKGFVRASSDLVTTASPVVGTAVRQPPLRLSDVACAQDASVGEESLTPRVTV